MPKFGVGRFVFWGVLWGGWRFGAGGGRCVGWPCVSCVVFDVLLCILTKYFFRVCLLVFSSLLFSLLSSLLPGEFFPLLCLLAWLAVAFFRSGLLCTAELRFSDRFFGPCSHIVGMCSCKARRFAEALRFSWFFNFALFLFASAFFWSGFLCSAQFQFLQLRTSSKSLTFYLRVL